MSRPRCRPGGPEADGVQAYALMMAGAEGIYRETGPLDRPMLERSIGILREVNDEWGLALGLLDVGIIETYNGNYDEAASGLEEGAVLFRRLGDSWGLSQTLNSLGDVCAYVGITLAPGSCTRSLALYRELNVQPDIPASLHNLGYIALSLGERDKARALFVEALDLQVGMKNKGGIAECVAGLGAVAAVDGEAEKAARLLAFADTVRASEGIVVARREVEYELHSPRWPARSLTRLPGIRPPPRPHPDGGAGNCSRADDRTCCLARKRLTPDRTRRHIFRAAGAGI